MVRQHRFAHDDLARGLSCLVEQWGDDELDGAARERALRMARVWSYGELVAAQDWVGYGDVVTPDAVQIDHRPTGVGEIRGRSALVAWIRELAAVSEQLRADIVDVLALTPEAALVRNVASGVAAGGPYRIPSYVAFRFGADGRLERSVFFPEERLDDAWACFDRLATAVRAAA